MAYAWEQVVLYLKVEPAGKPGDDLIAACKIGCRNHLVDGPLVLYLQLIVGSHVLKGSFFYHMGELEYNGQGDTHDNVHTHKSDEPGHPAQHECGNEDIEQYV